MTQAEKDLTYLVGMRIEQMEKAKNHNTLDYLLDRGMGAIDFARLSKDISEELVNDLSKHIQEVWEQRLFADK